jgi:hypothetical protein
MCKSIDSIVKCVTASWRTTGYVDTNHSTFPNVSLLIIISFIHSFILSLSPSFFHSHTHITLSSTVTSSISLLLQLGFHFLQQQWTSSRRKPHPKVPLFFPRHIVFYFSLFLTIFSTFLFNKLLFVS